MQKINIQFLKPGMEIGKTIYSSDGKVLLSEGLKIKSSYIDKLMDLGITEIYVNTSETSDIDIKDVIEEQNRLAAKEIIKLTMEKVYIGKEFSTELIHETVLSILDDLLNDDGIIMNLSDIRAVDDYTFGHSVNVCVLSLISGISMGYDKDKLIKLGIGAILHDIGKILVSQDILNKPGSLNEHEFNEIKKHTQLGYEILQRYPKLDNASMLVVLEHHERYNGTGYPAGKREDEIHEFARIVAIADVYDALTSDRVYKKKIFPHEAIEYLISMGNHHFDYDIVKKFTLHVASYPIGTMVQLSSGIQGVVIGNNKNYPNRPKIRCVLDGNGRRFAIKTELELTNNPSVTIAKVIEYIG